MAEEKKKRGRPYRVDNNPRKKHLDVRVTEDEMAEIKEIAASMGISVTELIIKAIRYYRNSTT